jgi:hypothetical protein
MAPKKAPALKARFTSCAISIIIRGMPQSLSILHIIFSTKNRESWLDSEVRPRMHAYLATICRDLGANLRTLAVLLITFTLSRPCRELLPKLGLSKTSSKWIKGFYAPDGPEKSLHADRLGSSDDR